MQASPEDFGGAPATVAEPPAAPATRRSNLTRTLATVDIDGTIVHLAEESVAQAIIADAAAHVPPRPLGVASINLDHVHHFGDSRRAARGDDPFVESGRVEWLNLIDGKPIATQAARVTGRVHPKLSGSDLIAGVLDLAAERGQSVGVLGGMPDVEAPLRDRFERQWPTIRFAGHWTPDRALLASPLLSEALAHDIRAAQVDILLVCLGKPRQEVWIDEYGAQTGAGALLAFGAVVDFLAGRVARAPGWASRAGLEWAWRLLREPRRLARRYLIQGPPAYAAVRRSTA
jgi:exopolysaccharide biosynthesis WecB/TagA/CpsF family protein